MLTKFAALAYKKMFGSNARLIGEAGLGISVPGQDNMYVFVPYKTERGFSEAIKRLENSYPNLQVSSSKTKDKRVFTGKIEGQPLSVAVAYGPRAQRFDAAYSRAKSLLTPEMRSGIITKKEELKKKWLMSGVRYKRYNTELAKVLGLTEAYF